MPAFRIMKDIGAPTHTFLTMNFCYRVLENITEYYRVHLAHQLRPFFGIVSQGLVEYFFSIWKLLEIRNCSFVPRPFFNPILFSNSFWAEIIIYTTHRPFILYNNFDPTQSCIFWLYVIFQQNINIAIYQHIPALHIQSHIVLCVADSLLSSFSERSRLFLAPQVLQQS